LEDDWKLGFTWGLDEEVALAFCWNLGLTRTTLGLGLVCPPEDPALKFGLTCTLLEEVGVLATKLGLMWTLWGGSLPEEEDITKDPGGKACSTSERVRMIV
jgi:hypothetical protein